jgi:hypothetical protein
MSPTIRLAGTKARVLTAKGDRFIRLAGSKARAQCLAG